MNQSTQVTQKKKPFKGPPLTIVPRVDWGAKDAKAEGGPMEHPLPMVMFHMGTGVDTCSTKEECEAAVREIQRRHMEEEGADDIKYNFIVGGDFRVYEGRGFFKQCCPTLKLPHYIPVLPEPTPARVLQIAFVGKFDHYSQLPLGYALVAHDCANEGVLKGYVEEGYSYYEYPNSLDISLPTQEEMDQANIAQDS